jgi:hypothetical protein
MTSFLPSSKANSCAARSCVCAASATSVSSSIAYSESDSMKCARTNGYMPGPCYTPCRWTGASFTLGQPRFKPAQHAAKRSLQPHAIAYLQKSNVLVHLVRKESDLTRVVCFEDVGLHADLQAMFIRQPLAAVSPAASAARARG